jgi:hypothetical protein
MRRSTSFCPFGPFLLFSHTPAPHRHLQRPSCCPALATKAVDPERPHSTAPLLMLSTRRLDAATACRNHPTIRSKNRRSSSSQRRLALQSFSGLFPPRMRRDAAATPQLPTSGAARRALSSCRNGESQSSTGERMRAGAAWSLRASSSSTGGGWLRRPLDFKRYPSRRISSATSDFAGRHGTPWGMMI